MQDLADAGDREAAVERFFREAGGVADVDALPVSQVAAIVETIIRENRVVEWYNLAEDLSIFVPTLLLTGEHGPDHLRDGVLALHETLSESRLVELAGVDHVAIFSAPELVAAEGRTFGGGGSG